MCPATPPQPKLLRAGDRSLLLAVCIPLVLVLVVLLASPNFRLKSGPEAEPFAGDFLQEWIGGWMLLEGDRSRFYDLSYIKQLEHDPALVGFEWDHDAYLPMVYPPCWYLLVSPLSRCSLPTAALLWTLLMTACLIATALLLRWDVCGPPTATADPADQERRATRATLLTWGLPATLLFSPLLESLGSGQKGTLLLLLFTGTYVLLRRRQMFWAGVVFGLIAFKPHLTLVIGAAMLLRRQWAFLAGGAVTGAVLVGLSLLTGLDVCRQFVALCTGLGDYVHTGGYDLHKAHSWWGAMQLLLDGAPDVVIKTCALLGSLLTIALLSRSLPGHGDVPAAAFPLQYSALVLATLLLSPHLFNYDLTLLLLPLFLIADWAQTNIDVRLDNRRALLATATGLFAVCGLSPQLAALTGVQLTVVLMVALLALLARAQATQTFSVDAAGTSHAMQAHNTAPA